MSVLFLPEIREYFENLAIILYEKKYFGFEEAAQNEETIYQVRYISNNHVIAQYL